MSSRTSPETPGQAAAWERTKRLYLAVGLCHRCAAQAAYGHSHGFSVIEQPCPVCKPVIATFEHNAPNGWRKASQERLVSRSDLSVSTGGTTETGEAA